MKERFSIFFSLVSVLFKERKILDFSDKKKLLTKLSLYLFLLVGLAGLIYLLFYLLQTLGVLGLGGYIPLPIFNVVLILLLIFAVVTSIPKLANTLFLSEDNHMLLTYPLKEKTIFFAKLFVYYIEETIRSLYLYVPLIYAYAILSHLSIGVFFWVIFILPFISLFVVAFSVLLSIPYIYIKVSLKRFDIARGLLILLVLIILSSLSFYLVNLIPEDLQIVLKWNTVYFPGIINTSAIIEKYLYPFIFISTLVFNYRLNGILNPRYNQIGGLYSWLVLLGLIAVSVILIYLSSLAAKTLIRKGATATLENDKKGNSRKRKDVKRHSLMSIIYHEIILDVRTTSRLVSNYLAFFIPIFATLVLNVIFKATHISHTGDLLVTGLNFFFIILLTTITNMDMASKISREGEAFNQLKISSKSPLFLYTTKVLLHGVIMIASVVICTIIYHLKLQIAYSRFDLVLLTFIFVYIAHLLFSTSLDVAHPKRNLYKDMGLHSNPINPNEIISGITSLLIALLFFGLAYFFINDNLIKGYISIVLFASLFIIGSVTLFIRKVLAYQKSIGGEL